MTNPERDLIKSKYGRLFDTAAETLFRHDPVGINFQDNTDEYEPEVGTILPRLESVTSESDALEIIHEEFIHWFDADIAGAKENYLGAAAEIWSAWQKFKAGE